MQKLEHFSVFHLHNFLSKAACTNQSISVSFISSISCRKQHAKIGAFLYAFHLLNFLSKTACKNWSISLSFISTISCLKQHAQIRAFLSLSSPQFPVEKSMQKSEHFCVFHLLNSCLEQHVKNQRIFCTSSTSLISCLKQQVKI